MSVNDSTMKTLIAGGLDDLQLSAAQWLRLKGYIDFHLKRKNGEEKSWSIDNVITLVGEDAVADLIGGTGNAFDYIAIGEDGTGASNTQTALEAEIVSGGGERAQDAAASATNNVYTASNEFTFTATLAIQEVGLFNHPSVGTMLARQTFSVVNVGDGDKLTVTWNIRVGADRS